MEGLSSASLGVVGSLLTKLDKLQSTKEWARQLTGDLGNIRTKLKELSMVHNPPHTVNYWMKDARELFYDMEDFLDDFVHASSVDSEIERVNKLISRFKNLMEELIDRHNRYNLEYVHRQTTNTLPILRLPVVHGWEPPPVILVGIDGPANEILRWLKPTKGDDDREKELQVVSIHGVEGVGKSTLAQKLWRELERDFECRAFIQTAKKPDIRMILRSILSQVRPEQPPENFQVPNLIQDIKKHLQNKRYFIVIDDIWTVSIWDVLSRAFPDSNCFGIIIITAITENTALACCSYDPNYIFRMEPLSANHSKSLFISTAFGSENGCPSHVDDCLDEITKKCGGLPLALTCLAAVLARLPETEQQVERFEFLCKNLRTNSTAMEILEQVLKLCYNSLPQSLKTCLLYLCVYPMSHTIVKEDLVKQWVAEGFICAFDGKDIEEVGRCYFDELLNLNLIQWMDISNSDKKKVSYRVHPVVYYFVTSNSMKDNFIKIIDYSQTSVVLTDKIRRLALHFCSATYATAPANTELSQVRSFAFMGLVRCMPSLEEFKLVRVMILHLQDDHREVSEQKDDHRGMTFSLTEICNMFLLRYLQVRCRVTVTLPDQVQCLKHLETLEVNAVVAAVPSGIVDHPSLKHVRLGRKRKHNHHLIMDPDTSYKLVFLNSSNRPCSASLQKLMLLPPFCSFSRFPPWVRQLRGLRILETVVRELRKYDIEYLSDLPFLTVLSLYVWKPTPGQPVTFRRGAFPVLKYLKVVSSDLLLSFREMATCNLEKLKIGFNIHRGENCGQKLDGIHHLLKLQVIVASIGAAEESGRIAAESALRDTISKHPCPPSIKMKRVESFDEGRDSLRNCPPADQKKKQSETQEEDSSPTEDSTRSPASVPPGVKELATGPTPSSAAAYEGPQIKIGNRSVPTEETEIELGVLDGMMDSVLAKLSGQLELDHTLPSEVRKDIILIHLKLEPIFQKIRECSGFYSLGYMDGRSWDWFNDCRELVLDIEDFADLWTLHIDTSSSSSSSSSSSMFMTFFRLDEILPNLRNITRRAAMQHQWPLLSNSLDDLPSYFLIRRSHRKSYLFVPYTTSEELVGIAGTMEEVSKMVMEAGETGQHKIISIVGMAGCGKTTLAAEVYRKLVSQGYFQHSAFITGGLKLDMDSESLKDMLLQFDNKHEGHDSHEYDDSDIDQLIERVSELLMNRRYLIVVDDLWRTGQLWQTIKRCIQENKHGSRIIITTRNTALATDCSVGSINCVYKIGLLSDTDSKSLFLKGVFGNEHACPRHLETISAQIIRRCGGLPLALISFASSLKYCPPTQEEWERHRLNFLSSSDGKYMMQILSLSWNDLPPSLKPCMLYLSIFPDDYEMDIERLMRLWIAEGFIRKPGVEAAEIFLFRREDEETARRFVEELISRNIVQPLHPKHNGIPRYCRVHPVMHDFIVYKAIEENFITLVDVQRQDAPANNGSTVRRLSLHGSSTRDQKGAQIAFSDLSHARTIIISGQASAVPPLTNNLKVVRVLDLDGCRGKVCLDGLHNLLLLRYLSLRGTDVRELPYNIGELRCLETLDVRSTNVKKLPRSIMRLEKLMHLLTGSVMLPQWIRKMEALQTLSGAIVMNSYAEELSEMVENLSEFPDLKELDLSCDLTEVPWAEKHFEFPVDGFQSLRQLCMQGTLPSVTFGRSVLPRVETLELKFKTCMSGGIFGVENLLSLKYVLLEFSEHDASAMKIVDTVREAASLDHPNQPEVTVIVDGSQG